jgi:hypothetical protein
LNPLLMQPTGGAEGSWYFLLADGSLPFVFKTFLEQIEPKVRADGQNITYW